MITKQLRLYLIVIIGLLHMGATSAATLSFDPSVQSGNSVSVDLRISGLGSDILAGFDLDIGFDDSILGFQSFTFGTGLDDLAGLGFPSLQLVDGSTPGLVNVYELSFDFDEDLTLFQPNDFVLGTFTFDALSIGTSALTIIRLDMVGELASSLNADIDVVPGSVSVVPVPAAAWLFATGLIGLIGFSRRRKALA